MNNGSEPCNFNNKMMNDLFKSKVSHEPVLFAPFNEHVLNITTTLMFMSDLMTVD